MPFRTPEVSIVIPNYQGRSVLPQTLSALEVALAGTTLRSELLVVDDASRDGSPEQVERDHPTVRLLRQPRNRGFGPTCNLGVQQARASRVFLLNSDVSVHAGFLEPLVEELEAGDRFSVAALNLDEAGRVRPPNQVCPALRRGQIRLRSMDLEPLRRAGRLAALGPIPTLFGTGGSLLVRRDRFLALGGFADVFAPFYYEDTDLGWRAWRRGWSSVVEPRSLVTHRSGGSISSTRRRRDVKAIRKCNRFLLVWRNLLDPRAFRRQHLARLPGYVAGALLRGDASVARGLVRAWTLRTGIAAFREQERAAAKLADVEIFARLAQERARLERAMADSPLVEADRTG